MNWRVVLRVILLRNTLMELIIDIRQQARANKDWSTSDKIRDALKDLEIVLKDSKEVRVG